MLRCPSCAKPVEAGSRECAACGAACAGDAAETSAPPTSPAPQGPAPAAHHDARFLPGTLLASRYRIVALLGRGGMGEVYRADDTRLGQTVALKFLPEAVGRDAATRERFLAEVRIGRQVSHPNVCRLYDIVEIDGSLCLSMEFVDGEDLASLVARIGRLPAAKAVDIARDLCAGLGAAHDKGVIHRDLKPANVMIDGKGRARIADFGIAALADEVEGAAFAGTPAYMAPELLDGKPASVRSDLYALGLVLHEACTGQRLFAARSLAELKAMHATTEPPGLSSSVRDVPVELERLVLRCLARDPEDRPPSAHAAMAALPGGDPLQAAMAAGETPSPAMVAAAGRIGDLPLLVAWRWLGVGIALLLAVLMIGPRATLAGRLAPEQSPELLAEDAREILHGLGYTARPGDTSAGFSVVGDIGFAASLDGKDRAGDRLATLRPGPLRFVHRQAPGKLVAVRTLMRGFGPPEYGRITTDDPARTEPGMIDVLLDREGRLVGLAVVPEPGGTATTAEVDWAPLFAAAQLQASWLAPRAVTAVPPVPADRQAAWTLRIPGQRGEFLVDAASYRGRPVWFDVRMAGEHRGGAVVLPTPLYIAIWTVLGFSVFAWIAVGVLIRRHLRQGRGDRAGAWRLTLFLLATSFAANLLRADHVAAAFEEIQVFVVVAAQSVLFAAIAWAMYIALEPVARRRWPQLLVGWTRLLSGKGRDPLVGRDVLVGLVAGLGLALCLQLGVVAPPWLGFEGAPPRGTIISTLAAARHLGYFILWSPFAAVGLGLGTLLGLVVFQALVRVRWLAVALLGVTLYFAFPMVTGLQEVWSTWGLAFTVLYLVVALRAGVLSASVAIYAMLVIEATPFAADPGTWYADRMWLTLALLAGALAYGFHTALGGKPMFGSAWVDRD